MQERVEIWYPETVAERTVAEAALVGDFLARGDSVYFDHTHLGQVRVSNHARWKHHSANFAGRDRHPDLHVLIMTPEAAEEYEAARAEFPREVRASRIVIRKSGERYKTTARALRMVLAEALMETRRDDPLPPPNVPSPVINGLCDLARELAVQADKPARELLFELARKAGSKSSGHRACKNEYLSQLSDLLHRPVDARLAYELKKALRDQG